MAKRKADVGVDYGAEVTRVYGVVPRPRYRDCPEAWARTKRPGKWRTYYGYRYRPGMAELSTPFPGAAVAAAMVAHSELGGRILAPGETAEEKRAAFMAEAVASVTHKTPAERMAESERVILRKPATPRERGRNGVDYHVTVREPAPIAPPEPVEAPPVRETPAPLPEPAPAPIVAPEPSSAPAEALPACTCEHDRLALAAAVLRELAGAYGPRRAHKLQAMADFVAAHGSRAAA